MNTNIFRDDTLDFCLLCLQPKGIRFLSCSHVICDECNQEEGRCDGICCICEIDPMKIESLSFEKEKLYSTLMILGKIPLPSSRFDIPFKYIPHLMQKEFFLKTRLKKTLYREHVANRPYGTCVYEKYISIPNLWTMQRFITLCRRLEQEGRISRLFMINHKFPMVLEKYFHETYIKGNDSGCFVFGGMKDRDRDRIVQCGDVSSEKMGLCMICQEKEEDMEAMAAVVVELPCHHCFHQQCIHLWFERNVTCPLCRTSLASSVYDDEEHEIPRISSINEEAKCEFYWIQKKDLAVRPSSVALRNKKYRIRNLYHTTSTVFQRPTSLLKYRIDMLQKM